MVIFGGGRGSASVNETIRAVLVLLIVPRVPCCLLSYDSRLCISVIQSSIGIDIDVDIPGLQFVWLSSSCRLGILKLILELDIFLVVTCYLLLMHLPQFLRDH